MKIKRLFGSNFQGATDIELFLDGGNATIRGQNGSGKTTRFNLYCWIMTGKMADGKTAEIGNYNSDDEMICGEVEFNDGTTYRRETNGTSRFYVDGAPVNATNYFSAINAKTNNAATILTSPFNFCQIHWSERRKILMQLFGNVTDAAVLEGSGLEELIPLLQKQTTEQIKRAGNDKRKKLSAELTGIPARIDELLRDKIDGNIEEVQARITELEQKLQQIGKTAFQKNLQEQLKTVAELERGINKASSELQTAKSDLTTLRKQWIGLENAQNGTCPTCGANLPDSKIAEFKNQQVTITENGKQLAERCEVLKRAIETARLKIDELNIQIDSTQKQLQKLDDKALRDELTTLKVQAAALQRQAANNQRIEALRAREIEINALISQCDKQIYLAEEFTRRKAQMIQDAINSQFEIVTWRLFRDYKTQDGDKECCDAMIDDVPYSALSKGEKLKAMLDIIKTLQRAFNVELPIWIDDAECYTSNCLLDMPNQIIKLQAAEGVKVLEASIDDGTSDSKWLEGQLYGFR